MHNPHGIKLLTRLRNRLSHLREHKFRHNFQDSLDPFCNCGRHIETTIHFFLHCSNYSNQRKTLFEKVSNIKRSLLNQNNSIIAENLLFGSTGLNDEGNACIIESTIEYIIAMERFMTLFICSIFLIYILYIVFNALLNVYQQDYVVYNLFF